MRLEGMLEVALCSDIALQSPWRTLASNCSTEIPNQALAVGTYEQTDTIGIFILPETMDNLDFDQVCHIIIELLPS
jgi:hypothetical protein